MSSFNKFILILYLMAKVHTEKSVIFFICIPTYKSFHVRYLYVSIILNSMYVQMSHVSFDSTTQSIHNLPSSWLPAWNRLMSSILSRKIVSGPDIIYLMMYLMTCKKAFALEFIYQKNTFHDDNAVFYRAGCFWSDIVTNCLLCHFLTRLLSSSRSTLQCSRRLVSRPMYTSLITTA